MVFPVLRKGRGFDDPGIVYVDPALSFDALGDGGEDNTVGTLLWRLHDGCEQSLKEIGNSSNEGDVERLVHAKEMKSGKYSGRPF